MSQGVALDEVSESTGISPAVLQALENEDREQLPAEVYVKAFYKKYAAYLGVDFEEIQAEYKLQAQTLEKTGQSSGFSTVITLKGQEENLFTEILRRLFLPLAILILGALLFWIYKNYLTPYNPLGFYRKHFPALCSFLFSSASDFFC